MTRPHPAILVTLLILGSAVAGGQVLAQTGQEAATQQADLEHPPSALEPVEGTSPNSTRVLQLDTTDAADFERGDLSVTNALRAATANDEATMTVYAAQTALDRSSSEAAREAVFEDVTAELSTRLDDLEAREARARAGYVAGDTSARKYLVILGEVNTQASRLQTLLSQLNAAADGQSAIQDRLSDMQARTFQFQSPLRDDLGAAVAGAGTTDRLYVGASGQGVVLATIRDGTYVRGAVRTDARDEAIGGVDLDAAQDRIAELYPWAWSNNAGVNIRAYRQDVVRFQLSHNHGSLDSFLDTSSGNVFREVQEKSLSRTPAEPAYTRTANNTTVIVSQTYAGGPVKVNVQNATGAPLPATVEVNGTTVGETGAEGSVWAISPAGSYMVTAQTDTETLNVSVSAG